MTYPGIASSLPTGRHRNQRTPKAELLAECAAVSHCPLQLLGTEGLWLRELKCDGKSVADSECRGPLGGRPLRPLAQKLVTSPRSKHTAVGKVGAHRASLYTSTF